MMSEATATNTTLIIFAKNPIKGRVKTRLAKTTGPEKALQIYKELLAICKGYTQSLPFRKVLYHDLYSYNYGYWPKEQFIQRIQKGANLGDRMAIAFKEQFEYAKQVLIIGADCPYLGSTILQEAADKLKTNDLVIGPSLDGGYYLMGMRHFEPSLFQNINWSTETVLTATIEKAKQLSLRIHLLPTLSDIDHYEDWEAFLSSKEV